MKLLFVEGYTHEGGNTAKLSDRVLDALRAKGHEVMTTGLRDRRIGDCRNCGGCTDSHRCVQNDDMTPLYDKVAAAEGIILTTPVYMWGMTAGTKAFLDRLYAVTDSLEDKRIGLVVTAGSDAFSGCDLVVQCVQRFADYFGMDMADTLYAAPANDGVSDAQVEKFVDQFSL